MNKKEFLISNSEQLADMYCNKRMTTREIGIYFGMSKHPVEDALMDIGVSKLPRTKGTKPTKEFIENAIFNDCRSLMDIARELNCDPGAIKWWAKEYGITIPKMNSWYQRNKQHGYARPDKEILEILYREGKSLQNIAEIFNSSRQQISDAFKYHGISVRKTGWGHKSFDCKDGHRVKSTYEQRVDDWLYEQGVEHIYEPHLPFSNRGHSDFLCGEVYIEIFGVIDSEKYNRRKKIKIEQYQICGAPVIFINYWDFASAHNGLWGRKLSHLVNSSLTSLKKGSASLSHAPPR